MHRPNLVFDYLYFAEELKKNRESNKHSMRGLGKKLDMTPVTISRIENKQIEPRLETILKIVNYFDMDLFGFFQERYD